MYELQDQTRDGDFKFLVSEELTKTEGYQILKEKEEEKLCLQRAFHRHPNTSG